MEQTNFKEDILGGYTFKGDQILIGAALQNNNIYKDVPINLPLKTFNRHGLIAGATGTGKTKTLQKITEELSLKGVPVLMMDIKGDFSGISLPGTINPKVEERVRAVGIDFHPQGFPVEFYSLSNEKGARLRATVSEFGPVLFSRILDLNDTQSGVVSLVFKFCDDNKLPLLDLKDFKKVMQYLTNEGKKEIEKEYGRISTASTSTIMRKILELEEQGADLFFGEPSFDVNDLLRHEGEKGIVSIIRLTDIQDKPKLFSTFMLCLLAELYHNLPEAGDLDKPKLVVFIDEAHLVFKEASKTLLEQLESIIKLIRSKGVGIFFCTQNPTDIPAAVLSQLGLKIQHALRAFTAADRKAIKLAAENYPETNYYKTSEVLTSLGIGEAFITTLNEKGTPTPLVHAMLSVPSSRMDVLTPGEIGDITSKSAIYKKYNVDIDRESAYEMLSQKLEESSNINQDSTTSAINEDKQKPGKSLIETITSNPMAKQVGRTVAREVVRGLLGVLGLTGGSKRKKSTWL